MFRKSLFFLIFAWILIVFFSIKKLISPSSQEIAAYRDLMDSHDLAKKEFSQDNVGPLEQKRYQVNKQMLYTKGQDRLQSCLASDSSDLIYTKKGGELIEELKGLTCIVQEKVISSENEVESKAEEHFLVRKFKAENAVYSYKTGQLEAEKVEFEHYLLSNHQNLQMMDHFSPMMKGKAHSILLSLLKEPQLKAQGFQGIFYSLESEP